MTTSQLTPDPMKLLIIEDDTLIRNNLKLLLDGEQGIEVIDTCGSAEEADAKLDKLNPEIILCDLGLPGMSGTDFIPIAKSRLPDIDIMAYTIFEDHQSVFSALKAGATGYILKNSTSDELIDALFTLREGGSPMTPKIARAVIQELQENKFFKNPKSEINKNKSEEFLLSNREKEVLIHIEAGLSYKQIGEKLYISRNTVHSHIKNIYEKLQAKNKQEAILQARDKGIL